MTQPQSTTPRNKKQLSDASQSFDPSNVLVFLEDSNVNEASIRHAQNVAHALGGTVELLQVLRKPTTGNDPIDPVGWDIKKQKVLNRLGLLSKKVQAADTPCPVTLLEGKCSSQIQSLMELRSGDIAASMRSHNDGSGYPSETAWAILKSQSAAVLMLPNDAKDQSNIPYQRILVPLDGSPRAEAALPVAVKIAQAQKAELMLCYAPPEPRLTEINSNGHEAEHLHAQVRNHNEKAGETYLQQTKKRLEHTGAKVSVKNASSGDVRRSLIDTMSRENADFVVMATHGQSGHMDVPTGDVARFVLEKAHIPVLLVRSRNGHNGHHTFGKLSSKGVRQPTGTD